MRIFLLLWKKTAVLPMWKRSVLKFIIFCSILLAILFPNPMLLVKQLDHYVKIDSLIQTDFKALETINRQIDALLPPHTSLQREFLAIQRYVYKQIRYEYDWENWGNIDFWPTAEQVWKRKREDCDGRAILAASILRSRGFETATIVGNMRHIWIHVDQFELMGPDREQNISRKDGKTIVTLPSFNLMIDAFALYIADFPTIRNLLLLFVTLVLCYHPGHSLTRFLGMTTLGLVGFILIKDWAQEMMTTDKVIINMYFSGGCGLLGLSIFFSLFGKKIDRGNHRP
jgi:hypothetical protein